MRNKRKQSGWVNTDNIYGFLLCKFLLALLLLLLTQVYFYCCNSHLFHVEGSEWWGIIWGNLVMGVITIGFALLPYFIAYLLPLKCRYSKHYQRTINFLLYILPLLFIAIANCSDTAYFQYTYRRLTGEIFQYLGISGNMSVLIPRFIVDYWYAPVGMLVSIILAFFFSSRVHLIHRKQYGNMRGNNIINTGLALVCVGVIVFVVLTLPSHRKDITRYCQGQNSALVTNSGYNIFCTLMNGGRLDEVRLMDNSAAHQLFNAEFPITNRFDNNTQNGWNANGGHYIVIDSLHSFPFTLENRLARQQQRNVVVIVLESFSQEFMGCYNKDAKRSYTPFLDSLAEHSFVYQGRANGKKSIEGIPAIFGSLPTLMAYPLALTPYSGDSLNALPSILARNGYHTAFFHGSYNGVMEFDKLCTKLGFQEYYGKNEYFTDRLTRESDFDGCWGIFDEYFLQFMSRRLTTFKEPFFAGVFTLSSHHPYTMDPAYANKFEAGPHPILSVVQYTDNALRKFFKEAEKTDWYKHTTFIITADHSGHGLTPEYNGYTGWYRIPMMVYIPGSDTAYVSQRLMQQTDIMPTLLDYLGIKSKAVCFGTSLFRNPNEGWQIAFGNDYYQLETQEGVAVLGQKKEEVHGKGNIDLLKSIVQQYNARLIHNQIH